MAKLNLRPRSFRRTRTTYLLVLRALSYFTQPTSSPSTENNSSQLLRSSTKGSILVRPSPKRIMVASGVKIPIKLAKRLARVGVLRDVSIGG